MGSGADPGRRSLADTRQGRVYPDLCNDRLAGDRPLAEQDLRRRARRQINVDAAAEADKSDALARLDVIALADEGEDPPRDQSRDLRHSNLQPIPAFDQKVLALIVLARLVEVGVDELAWYIGDTADSAGNGRPIYVDVEDAHENRDARIFAVRH